MREKESRNINFIRLSEQSLESVCVFKEASRNFIFIAAHAQKVLIYFIGFIKIFMAQSLNNRTGATKKAVFASSKV
jgi:hypothetical protein